MINYFQGITIKSAHPTTTVAKGHNQLTTLFDHVVSETALDHNSDPQHHTLVDAVTTPQHDVTTEWCVETRHDSSVSVAQMVCATVSTAEGNYAQLSTDPTSYAGKRITSSDINHLLILGCCQPGIDYQFPKTNGRQCNHSVFTAELPDGRSVKRDWLTYSINSDRLFCFYCCLFGGVGASEVWTITGYNSWSNISRDVKIHAASPEHRASEVARVKWIGKHGNKLHRQMVVNNSTMVAENREVV